MGAHMEACMVWKYGWTQYNALCKHMVPMFEYGQVDHREFNKILETT